MNFINNIKNNSIYNINTIKKVISNYENKQLLIENFKIDKIENRSNNNIKDIKKNLKNLENTLIIYDDVKSKLIDAIIKDAGESINYWQIEVKKIKTQLKQFLKSFVKIIEVQEKTKAALDILNDKYQQKKKDIQTSVNSSTGERWPKLWGTNKNTTPITGDKVNVDTNSIRVEYSNLINKLNEKNNTENLKKEGWIK